MSRPTRFEAAVAVLRDPDGKTRTVIALARRTLAREVARRAKADGYHHCACMFFRENEGKTGVRSNWPSRRWVKIVFGPPPPCGVCQDTGWCT